jgi:hypothetical protein
MARPASLRLLLLLESRLVGVVLPLGETVAEIGNAFTEASSELRELPGAENDHHDDENQEKFRESKSEHEASE